MSHAYQQLCHIHRNCTYYELSHMIEPNIPSWPNSSVPIEHAVVSRDAPPGAVIRSTKWKITLGTDAATHIDSPFHFYKEKADTESVTDLPTSEFFVPLCIIDVTERVQQNVDSEVMLDDIKQYESQYRTIPEHAFIAMRSGWSARWPDKEKFGNFNTDETSTLTKQGRMHFPGFDAECVKWLIENRNISAIGVDTYSFDAGYKDAFPTHTELLTKQKYGIEAMRLTPDIPVHGCFLYALPARVKGAPESWIRCVAVYPNDSTTK